MEGYLFTDLALANSWFLYCQDLNLFGTPEKNIMQVLEFCMEVAMTFLGQHNIDNSDFSEQNNDPDDDEPDFYPKEKSSSDGCAPCVSPQEGCGLTHICQIW